MLAQFKDECLTFVRLCHRAWGKNFFDKIIQVPFDESALETDPVFEPLCRLVAREQQASALFRIAEYAEWLYRALQLEGGARGQRLSDFEVHFLNDAIRSSGTLGIQESSQWQLPPTATGVSSS